jgi:hypothetical protein
MRLLSSASGLVFLALFLPLKVWAGTGLVVHHNLDVVINPQSHSINITDMVSLPDKHADVEEIVFSLHGDLDVELGKADRGSLYEAREAISGAVLPVHIKTYVVKPAYKQTSFTLHYSGKIYQPLALKGQKYAHGFRETAGNISTEGVFLAATSAWYPLIEGADVSFSMKVSMPGGWKAVSQGERLDSQESDKHYNVIWEEKNPQEEIYLIAARFHEYTKSVGAIEAMAFLRDADASLANRYLEVTSQYIEMYQKLIGPYPYSKFALVENFWETGYGMPSFTLLGSKVIRLPFILYTSYPHEILHNWWGNSVYVDYQRGNWAEGLTSYLADHLLKEQRGSAAPFRRNILQNYADFVSEGKDMPLTDFRSRHSSSSEAIGYGKSQMLFHMLRMTVGDELFVRSLQHFYQQNKFKQAGFDDLGKAFEQESKQKLDYFFDQWVTRTGAPELEMGDIDAVKKDGYWHLKGHLKQVQKSPAYRLTVPLVVTLEDRSEAFYHKVVLMDKQGLFSVKLPAKPLRIDVDPEFDVFRRVNRAEIPAALSQAFGAEQALIVLPAKAPKSMLAAYDALAAAWAKSQPTSLEVAFDYELDSLPEDKAVWLLGEENRFFPQMISMLTKQGVIHQNNSLAVKGQAFDLGAISIVLTARINPDSRHAVVWLAADRAEAIPGLARNLPHYRKYTARINPDSRHAVVWLAADSAEAIPGLARKLPHYRKYGYLVFDGGEPVNELKGQWMVTTSPMTVFLSGDQVAMANLKRRAALVE